MLVAQYYSNNLPTVRKRGVSGGGIRVVRVISEVEFLAAFLFFVVNYAMMRQMFGGKE